MKEDKQNEEEEKEREEWNNTRKTTQSQYSPEKNAMDEPTLIIIHSMSPNEGRGCQERSPDSDPERRGGGSPTCATGLAVMRGGLDESSTREKPGV